MTYYLYFTYGTRYCFKKSSETFEFFLSRDRIELKRHLFFRKRLCQLNWQCKNQNKNIALSKSLLLNSNSEILGNTWKYLEILYSLLSDCFFSYSLWLSSYLVKHRFQMWLKFYQKLLVIACNNTYGSIEIWRIELSFNIDFFDENGSCFSSF